MDFLFLLPIRRKGYHPLGEHSTESEYQTVYLVEGNPMTSVVLATRMQALSPDSLG